MKTKMTLLVGLLIAVQHGFSQGFVNLNFEAAKIAGNHPGGNVIDATNAFPGWTVTAPNVAYNDFALDGGSVSINDTNTILSPSSIGGNYFAFLFGANLSGIGPVSIGQVGQIPFFTQSMTFWGAIGGMQVTFNNQPLSFSTLGSTANYTIYGADVSPYAGQTGQLLFSVPAFTGGAFLDNIQFSPSPVPEPGTLGLVGLGLLGLGWHRRRRSS